MLYSYFTAADLWQLFDNDDADGAVLLVAEGAGGPSRSSTIRRHRCSFRSSIAVAQADVASTQRRRLGAGDRGFLTVGHSVLVGA